MNNISVIGEEIQVVEEVTVVVGRKLLPEIVLMYDLGKKNGSFVVSGQ